MSQGIMRMDARSNPTGNFARTFALRHSKVALSHCDKLEKNHLDENDYQMIMEACLP
jgi:hypothetical protein